MEIFSLIVINVPCICRKVPIHLRFNKKMFSSRENIHEWHTCGRVEVC